MSDIASHIRSIEPEGIVEPESGIVAPPRPVEKTPSEFDWGPVPWLWVAAWLIGWGLLIAIAAWWIGAGEVVPRAVWMWVVVWCVGGLAVAALLTRAAMQATERASTRRRLSRAHVEIMQLEERLQASTASMFQATKTLSDATEILLEQVDTSRDDLRNQIASAQTLTNALKSQTAGLVSAQSEATRSVTQRLGMSLAPEVTDTKDADTAPLNLRPAPEDVAVFAPPKATTTIPVVAPTPDRNGWTWTDMLKTVDADGDTDTNADLDDGNDETLDDGADSVISLMRSEGLSPDVLVDEGNILDAMRLWKSQGRGAMGRLLSIRFDEPARLMRERIDATPSERSMVEAFAALRGDIMERLEPEARLVEATTDAGKAWLFSEAVLAL